MNERSPRLDYLDSVVEAAFQRRKDEIPKTLELIASEPGKLEQTRYSSLTRAYEAIGGYLYAFGYPLSEIKEAFRNAAHSWGKVFELRGTEAPFPAYVLEYDPSKPPGPEGVVELRSLHEGGAKDFSVTNSRAGYIATCEALIAGKEDIAHDISALIWDPPNARYIAPRSFCTPNDQRLAYGFREFLHGSRESMDAELKKIRVSPKRESQIGFQAAMVRAISRRDAEGFIDNLLNLLAWHQRVARTQDNRRDPRFFLCVPGLALCAVAMKRDFCPTEDLPDDDVFLPLELIESP